VIGLIGAHLRGNFGRIISAPIRKCCNPVGAHRGGFFVTFPRLESLDAHGLKRPLIFGTALSGDADGRDAYPPEPFVIMVTSAPRAGRDDVEAPNVGPFRDREWNSPAANRALWVARHLLKQNGAVTTR
jgi:hypothetical protein